VLCIMLKPGKTKAKPKNKICVRVWAVLEDKLSLPLSFSPSLSLSLSLPLFLSLLAFVFVFLFPVTLSAFIFLSLSFFCLSIWLFSALCIHMSACLLNCFFSLPARLCSPLPPPPQRTPPPQRLSHGGGIASNAYSTAPRSVDRCGRKSSRKA
jgi:hypothetical protein